MTFSFVGYPTVEETQAPLKKEYSAFPSGRGALFSSKIIAGEERPLTKSVQSRIHLWEFESEEREGAGCSQTERLRLALFDLP